MPVPATQRIEVELQDLEALLERVKAEVDEKDYELLEKFVASFAYLTGLIEDKSTTIARLRKLLFGPKSEKSEDVLKGKDSGEAAGAATGAPEANAAATSTPEANAAATGEPADSAAGAEPEETTEEGKRSEKIPGHGRNGAVDYEGAERVEVEHSTLKHGDPCPRPGCEGKVYLQKDPAMLVRVRGLGPLAAIIWALERLRCNLCGEVFTAQPPPEAGGEEKFDATAASMIALLKYGTGLPFHRLEKLQKNLKVPLPASTQWEVVEKAAEAVRPAYEELVRQAAQGEVFHNDDTPMKLLEWMGKRREKALQKGDLAPGERTGVRTSGILARVGERSITLYFTGRKLAGENLAEVLQHRAAELSAPIQMSDGLSHNEPGEFATVMGNCLAHSRRKYVEVVESFPGECREVLEVLRAVYHNDAVAKERGMTEQERLVWHQAESGPLMERLEKWLRAQIEEHKVEPNSGLGQAMSYMLGRWERLTLFLRVPGAPLDNNVVERALKKVILHRKNAYFYRSEKGAWVGDTFMSLIYTAELEGENAFDYLTQLQRNAKRVRAAPGEWMPWNYRETLERLGGGEAARSPSSQGQPMSTGAPATG
jgi:hypothetical protein